MLFTAPIMAFQDTTSYRNCKALYLKTGFEAGYGEKGRMGFGMVKEMA